MSVMTRLRVAPVLAAVLLPALCIGAESPRPSGSVAEQYLFSAANAERQQRGLRPLRWEETLHHAAKRHAGEMARRQSISHQYSGEPDLAERGRMAGARFTMISENVGEAWSAPELHDAWMHSPEHRKNLLDPRANAMAISVERRGNELYAVEDFERTVETMSLADQENAVAELLRTEARVSMLSNVADARRTCEMSSGYAGNRRPYFVMRFTASSLDRLPDTLRSKLASGRYHSASVGACQARNTGPFSAYDVAVLLYP